MTEVNLILKKLIIKMLIINNYKLKRCNNRLYWMIKLYKNLKISKMMKIIISVKIII